MVRIWCLPIRLLDRQHLLGEHVELHTIWSVLTNHKNGYSKHPQTLRFTNRLGQLVDRHNQQIFEMKKRGYNHQSPLLKEVEPEIYVYTFREYQSDYQTLSSRGGILNDR